jgi:hypothetical protein
MVRRVLVLTCVALAATTGALADDGALVRKSMAPSPGTAPAVPDGYTAEAEHAFIQMMKFYVPIQAANGTVAPTDYFNVDEELVDTRDLAKPLVGVYIYGPAEGVEGVGFVGHGRRDAYGAVSLDDGETWKATNLSESAGLSSSDVVRMDVPLFADTGYAYPGDVVNVFHAIAGNKVLVAWPSRFCEQGQPSYSLDTDEPTADQAARRTAIADYLGIDLSTASPDDLYLIDMFGVGGQQGFVDYAEDKWEQNWPVGQVPYSCLWTARGVLVDGDDPRTEIVEATYMRLFNAERLTSGRRDVNRIETQCVAGAGCAITWQEDPEGLRPGQGEGPGEGWSGAIANSQTDIWYSYIDWEHFDVVQDPADATGATPMEFLGYEAAATDTSITQKPKPFVPFAMPMRMTDNAKCNTTNPQPYCYGAALESTGVVGPVFPDDNATTPMDYGLRDMCAVTVDIPTGRDQELTPICVTEDGLPLVGNTASTRPRLGLYGYDGTDDKVKDAVIDSAFVVVVAEEDKGLGKFGFYDSGDPCDPDTDEGCLVFDEGKNLWYHSFSMSLTDAVGGFAEDGLLANLGFHGNMLNQPEVDWQTGEFYPVRNTVDMWDFGDYNFEIYNTEIARRGSLLAQDIVKVHKNTTNSKAKDGLLALPAWKQGAMNQGGPADVMMRRIVMEKRKWELGNEGNPYAFRYMDCDTWAYADGSNPYYPGGVCLDSAINLSATVPDTCLDSQTGEPMDCPQVDLNQGTTFGIGDTDPILQGAVQGEGNTTKVLSWHQCPADFTNVSASEGTTIYTCDNDLRTDDSTLADQSWYNPLDVAKGHRGFLDGDFVMMLYAWSPNWRLNAKGSDRYELYIRRSFDGAETWTSLPKNFTTIDGTKFDGIGTVSCETFRSETTGSGVVYEPRVCNSYEAGAAEQARNVTQHKSMRITTLDPRYAATAPSITADPFLSGYTFTEEDTRDPSRFFIVYETGDNTTTALGEPEPLDLFYSRAVMFGDHYQVWAEETDLSVCYPSDPHDNDVPDELIASGFCNEFDQMEQGIPGLEASEASLTANPGGEFLYGVWAQMLHDETSGELVESDPMARRIWWIDGYIPSDAWVFGQGPAQ